MFEIWATRNAIECAFTGASRVPARIDTAESSYDQYSIRSMDFTLLSLAEGLLQSNRKRADTCNGV